MQYAILVSRSLTAPGSFEYTYSMAPALPELNASVALRDSSCILSCHTETSVDDLDVPLPVRIRLARVHLFFHSSIRGVAQTDTMLKISHVT